MKKRILSLCLALVMVLGLIPANAFAVNESAICQHTETKNVYAQKEGTATHTVTTICTACGEMMDTFTAVQNCEDQDNDGKCDSCKGSVAPACETCADENSDKLCDVCKRSTNKVPKLKDGVENRTIIIQTGLSYQLHDVTGGNIFTDDDDTLDWRNYRYRKSSDGGQTWGAWTVFESLMHGGISDSVVNSEAGVYTYQFQAFDGAAYSEDIWTLTLDTRDSVSANIKFYIGQDQNYKNNGNILPILELYVTAGVDENLFDYVGWFEKDGKTVYVYNPKDYTIIDGEKDFVEIDGVQYELFGYQKVTFTNSEFDANATDAKPSGSAVDGYNMYYAAISTGRYSTRGYGFNTATGKYDIYLGGQSMALPREVDIYGNGGNDIYLRVISIYTTSKKTDNNYFTAADYYAEMIMPVTGSMIHSGAAYVEGNYTYFPFLSWAAGNGSLYNTYVYPKDTDTYIFTQTINNTTTAGTTLVKKSMTLSAAMELKVTVPAGADFGLYFQYNNFNTKIVDPVGAATDNGNGTKTITYKVSKGGGNYTYRLTDPSGKYITKAGWLKNITANTEMTFTFSEFTDKASHDFSNLGTQVIKRDEADIQVFMSPTGFASLSEESRVRVYRMWQLINSDTANIMLEPDFNIQVLQGNASDIKPVNGGNALNNWLDVLPTTTDIVAINYNALDVYTTADDYGSHGGFFPATNPERTAVFVVTNQTAGKAVAHISFNGSKETDRGAEWDYNYDTWFYMNTDKKPVLDFTVTARNDIKVSYALVTTDANMKSTLSGWTTVTTDVNGRYYADLLPFRNAGAKGGTVIIKMEDGTGVSYALARAAEMSVNVSNASNPGEPFMPGDDISVTFDGLYRSINKISGIFNPTTYYLRYSAGSNEVNGALAQYQQMDNATITLTIPEDLEFPEGESTVEYAFTNGYVYGGMYSASSPFQSMYYMTDTGVGTNFSAVGTSFVLSRLADITVTVQKKIFYNVKLDVTDGTNALTGYTLTVTDPDGAAVEPQADGTYKLGYGEYRYSVALGGYVCTSGTFTLGSDSVKDVVNGVLTVPVMLSQVAENAWDGSTMTEPVKVGDVYQIGAGAELAWFANAVNGGNTKINGVLIADIDLAGYEWTAIGTNSKKFAGSFDGQNHKVYNLSVNYLADATAAPYKGLFGYTAGSASKKVEIKNLTVEGDIYLTSTKSVSNAYSGGVVGYASHTNLTNVHANVNVTVKRINGTWNYLGGLVGYVTSGSIVNCSNAGTIIGWGHTGGVAGNVTSSTVSGCVNTGNVTSLNSYAGGVAAYLSNANCTVSACYNLGMVSGGADYTGGVVGKNTNGTINNCFNAGVVNGNGSVAGAVVGQMGNADGVVKHLYYLEGTCTAGIGEVKDAAVQVATAVDAKTLASAEFIALINADLDNPAFIAGKYNPVFAGSCTHIDTTITTTYDRIKGTETHTVTLTCECGAVVNQSVENCADANFDLRCDICEGTVVCKHSETTTTHTRVDGTETHKVTVTCKCGAIISETTENCADTNEDLKCDICEGAIACKHTETTTTHTRVNGTETHKVTVICKCGEVISETNENCVDVNSDLKCDICNGAIEDKNSTPPQTGDSTNIVLLTSVAGVSLVALVVLILLKKKEYC